MNRTQKYIKINDVLITSEKDLHIHSDIKTRRITANETSAASISGIVVNFPGAYTISLLGLLDYVDGPFIVDPTRTTETKGNTTIYFTPAKDISVDHAQRMSSAWDTYNIYFVKMKDAEEITYAIFTDENATVAGTDVLENGLILNTFQLPTTTTILSVGVIRTKKESGESPAVVKVICDLSDSTDVIQSAEIVRNSRTIPILGDSGAFVDVDGTLHEVPYNDATPTFGYISTKTDVTPSPLPDVLWRPVYSGKYSFSKTIYVAVLEQLVEGTTTQTWKDVGTTIALPTGAAVIKLSDAIGTLPANRKAVMGDDAEIRNPSSQTLFPSGKLKAFSKDAAPSSTVHAQNPSGVDDSKIYNKSVLVKIKPISGHTKTISDPKNSKNHGDMYFDVAIYSITNEIAWTHPPSVSPELYLESIENPVDSKKYIWKGAVQGPVGIRQGTGGTYGENEGPIDIDALVMRHPITINPGATSTPVTCFQKYQLHNTFKLSFRVLFRYVKSGAIVLNKSIIMNLLQSQPMPSNTPLSPVLPSLDIGWSRFEVQKAENSSLILKNTMDLYTNPAEKVSYRLDIRNVVFDTSDVPGVSRDINIDDPNTYTQYGFFD